MGQAFFGEGLGLIHLDDLMCEGTETSLFECIYDPTHNCGHHEDAGVICMPECKFNITFMVLTHYYWHTFSHNSVVCNDGDIRLCDNVGYCGTDLLAGRLEYCIDEVWGTVCNNMWSVSDAKVACIQLGFSVSGEIV